MRSDLLRPIAFALAAALVPASASARAGNEDFQLWAFTTTTRSLSKQVEAGLDLFVGLTDDAGRDGLYLLRPSLAYKVDDRLSVGGGYTYFRRDPPGEAAINEHRTFQQVKYVVLENGDGPLISTTSRLEQRFAEGLDGTAWRLRHQTRFDLPLLRPAKSQPAKLKLALWNEMFYSVNATRWSGPSGLGVMFNSVALSFPIAKNVTFEPGYLNVVVFGPGPDRVSHVASASLAVRL